MLSYLITVTMFVISVIFFVNYRKEGKKQDVNYSIAFLCLFISQAFYLLGRGRMPIQIIFGTKAILIVIAVVNFYLGYKITQHKGSSI